MNSGEKEKANSEKNEDVNDTPVDLGDDVQKFAEDLGPLEQRRD